MSDRDLRIGLVEATAAAIKQAALDNLGWTDQASRALDRMLGFLADNAEAWEAKAVATEDLIVHGPAGVLPLVAVLRDRDADAATLAELADSTDWLD